MYYFNSQATSQNEDLSFNKSFPIPGIFPVASVPIMVLISDGNSEIGYARVEKTLSFDLFRHLIRSRAVTNSFWLQDAAL